MTSELEGGFIGGMGSRWGLAGAVLLASLSGGAAAEADEPPGSVPVTGPPPAPTAAPALPSPPAPPPVGYSPPGGYTWPPPSAAYAPQEQRVERFSSAMIVTGIISAGLGATGLALGSLLWATSDMDAAAAECRPNCPEDEIEPARRRETVGIALMIAGGVGVAVGVPLIAIGARKVPAVNQGSRNRSQPAAVVVAGPRVAGLRMTY